MLSMMKRLFILMVAFVCGSSLRAQDAARLHEMGKNYLIDGDYTNAETLLLRAHQMDTNSVSIIKDLTLCYYFEKDYRTGLKIIQPLFDKDSADDQCYQIAGNLYKSLKQLPACEALFQKGLQKFPDNGALYNEMGELLNEQKRPEAIDFWEKGIRLDPGYSKNYYNAANHYHSTGNFLWCMLYSEIFANMEPLSKRSPEVKDHILEGYKKIYAAYQAGEPEKDKNKFINRIQSNLYKNKNVLSHKINASTLTMLRTRFILDWYQDKSDKFPFFLFEYHQELLREGLFEAYNQWLLGASENLIAFQNWSQLHNQEYAALISKIRQQQFRIPKGQYYQAN
jgi:tetratricopeptide (TPR) repeat protein